MRKTTFFLEVVMPVHVADRPLNCSSPRDREKDWEKEMILTRLTLSACLVVGTMASMSVPVAAASPTGISGLNNNGNIHLIGERGGRQAGRGAGHRGAGHVGRGAGHRGTGYLGRGAGHRGAGHICLLYTSPSPRDLSTSRMPSSA